MAFDNRVQVTPLVASLHYNSLILLLNIIRSIQLWLILVPFVPIINLF